MNKNAVSKHNNLILLVEDNPTDELLTLRALKKANSESEVAIVRDGAEALDFIFCSGKYEQRDKNNLPNFILLDLKLPKLNGLQVLQKIRENERTQMIPVIILTSSKEEKDLQESYKLGANSYVQKPVNYEDFTKMAQQLGIYWFEVNEYPRYNLPSGSEASSS